MYYTPHNSSQLAKNYFSWCAPRRFLGGTGGSPVTAGCSRRLVVAMLLGGAGNFACRRLSGGALVYGCAAQWGRLTTKADSLPISQATGLRHLLTKLS
jgi:hypothetical protein